MQRRTEAVEDGRVPLLAGETHGRQDGLVARLVGVALECVAVVAPVRDDRQEVVVGRVELSLGPVRQRRTEHH